MLISFYIPEGIIHVAILAYFFSHAQINSAVPYSTQSSQIIDLFLQAGWCWDYTSTGSALASAAASTANAASQQTKMVQQCVINFLRQLPVPLQ